MEKLTTKIQEIKNKIELLKGIDSSYTVFGSNKHQYQFYEVLEEKKILQFEDNFNIKLPKEYVIFLTQIGNGGMGPYYGLEPIEHVLYDDLDYFNDSSLNPSLPFPYNDAWNLDFDDEDYDDKKDEFYFDTQHVNGLIRICNYGCGVSLNLVVNGAEYGNIWIDDRGSDGGIYPLKKESIYERITFLDWYEEWLNSSIGELESNLSKVKTCKNDTFWSKLKNRFTKS